jgi:DNA repair protein RecN (Recombination protein N)
MSGLTFSLGPVLEEMHLRGLGVIDDAVMEFGPGLTVVTGETGAGKTMVVTGLGLLMGGRADPGAVREGYSAALVEGRLRVDPTGAAATRAIEAGAELDDGDTLVVSRTVSAEGRSRARLGGVSVPVGTLIVLAGDLVAVHGQSDQIRLQSTTRQREALDRFAGAPVTKALAAYRHTFDRLRAVQARLTEITERSRERADEAERLRAGLEAIERLAPQPGEDRVLRAEARRLAHAEGLQRAAAMARMLLSGDAGTDGSGQPAAGLVNEARRALEGMAEHDPQLAELAGRAAEIGYLVDDLATDCASYAAGVESDPARLAAVEDRRAALTHLIRGYGEDVDTALDWARTASRRLFELDGDGGAIDELTAERDQLRITLGHQAAELSQARDAAAARLAGAVTAELQELSMAGARLTVEVRRRDGPDGLPVDLGAGLRSVVHGPEGIDDIEMLLAPHPGAPARPLGRGASGGELSRVMLGLEVVLGAVDPVPTFVFDEVDAGVGGRAALGIGRRLAELARTSQVLVVTHLPQVAAFADHHLVVRKGGQGRITSSGVHSLDAAGRVRELARMLGGLDESDSAQAHAEELLQLAAADRAAASGTASGAPAGAQV